MIVDPVGVAPKAQKRKPWKSMLRTGGKNFESSLTRCKCVARHAQLKRSLTVGLVVFFPSCSQQVVLVRPRICPANRRKSRTEWVDCPGSTRAGEGGSLSDYLIRKIPILTLRRRDRRDGAVRRKGKERKSERCRQRRCAIGRSRVLNWIAVQ